MANESESRQLPAEYLGLPVTALSDVREVSRHLADIRKRADIHLLAPPSLDFIPANYRVSFKILRFGEGDYFKVPGGKMCLLKHALDQLAGAANIDWLESKRLDDRSEPFYCEWQVTGRMRDWNGQYRHIKGTVAVDLRDGMPDALEAKGGLATARKFMVRIAESKAKNRAIRSAIGLKTAYEQREAFWPFVFPTLQFDPDMSNPEVAKMVTAANLGMIDQVYGGSQPQSAPVFVDARAIETPGEEDAPRKPPPHTPAHPVPEQRKLPDHGGDRDPWDDEPRERETIVAKAEEAPKQEARRDGDGAPKCSECGCSLSPDMAAFTSKQFGRPMCSPCVDSVG